MIRDNPITALVLAVGVVVVLLIGGCATFGDVPVGYNGVEECASTLTGKVVSEGWHNKAIWCRFDTVSIGNNQFESKDATAVSKDLQDVHTSVDVTWTYNPDHLVEIQRKYRGDAETIILAPNVAQALRQATSKFSATDLTTRRGDAQGLMEQLLRERLRPYNDDLKIIQLSLTNYSFSQAWESAVESKVVAGQNLLTEKTNLQIERVKADQAAAIASGKARSQAAQRQTLTPMLLQQAWIDKWDGHMPTVYGGGSQMLSMGNPFTRPSEEK